MLATEVQGHIVSFERGKLKDVMCPFCKSTGRLRFRGGWRFLDSLSKRNRVYYISALCCRAIVLGEIKNPEVKLTDDVWHKPNLAKYDHVSLVECPRCKALGSCKRTSAARRVDETSHLKCQSCNANIRGTIVMFFGGSWLRRMQKKEEANFVQKQIEEHKEHKEKHKKPPLILRELTTDEAWLVARWILDSKRESKISACEVYLPKVANGLILLGVAEGQLPGRSPIDVNIERCSKLLEFHRSVIGKF